MASQSLDKKLPVSLSIRGSLLARLQAHSERIDRSLSWLVDHAIEDWLTANGIPEVEPSESQAKPAKE
jgi:predicted transcriptional regulator